MLIFPHLEKGPTHHSSPGFRIENLLKDKYVYFKLIELELNTTYIVSLVSLLTNVFKLNENTFY